MAVNLCALLCILMLLACFTQQKPHDLPSRSMETRDPNIDTVWYKGRGIRPLGRFGRRMAQKGEGSYFGRHRFCYPEGLAVD
uniref:Prolactin releasing hormone n=1 Tax=Sinocyclocheilus anshuiensis TaxID=1608454 RepID=A0A671MGC8_9TELE